MSSYWQWLSGRNGRRAGLRRFWNWYLALHLGVGVVIATLVPLSVKEAANTVLIPLASLIVGLCFAWGGNAIALLQTAEIEELAEHHEGGAEEYVFVYQTAILVVMIAIAAWGLGGLGAFTENPLALAAWFAPYKQTSGFLVKVALYSWSSLALRECWHVVLGVQYMLTAMLQIRRSRTKPRDTDDT